jgi:signal transduction histidine kinase/CheY-like chemotaxis protein
MVANQHTDLQLIALLLIFAVTGGAVGAFGAYLPAFYAFFSAIAVAPIVWLFGQADPLHVTIGILFVMWFLAIAEQARRTSQQFVEVIHLRLENVGLVEKLRHEKTLAEEANVAKSRFLAAASHDLRQPIHALNLYLGAFTHLRLARPAASLLAKVRQCALIMDEMFRALLDISKLDAGAVPAQITVFPLAPLFARTQLEFEPQTRAKGLELRVLRCSAFVRSDPALAERILRNLVANAVRYTEHGRVVVGCRRRAGALRICVHDTGIGIEPQEQSLVFEEFYQVGNRERDRSKGLGLGLAIVERLTRLLEAPLTFISRPGRGSLFAFDLQRAEPVELPVLRLSANGARNGDLSGLLVVVVDDEELILDAAQILLKQWNCMAIAATSSDDALRQLANCTRAPDVLICDHRLRGGETGLTVTAAIRNEFNVDIPALLITGDTNPEEIRAIAASGLAVLHKPLREEELHDAICALREQAPLEER